MLKDIVEVRPLEGYKLFLRFEDGVEGVVDLERLVRFEGVFAALRARETFVQVQVHRDLGTIWWPTGADLDPDTLYARITGAAIGDFKAAAGGEARR
jgi:hypothetical protein